MLLFCPHCHTVLNINKNIPKNNKETPLSQVTPDDVSDDNKSENEESDEDIDKLSEVIQDIIDDKDIESSRFDEINTELLSKNKIYQSLDKKNKSLIQSKIMGHVEIVNDSIKAYYVCDTCKYNEIIEPKSLIVSRIGNEGNTDYVNYSRLSNKIYDSCLPVTRNYICPNEECPTITQNETKEAVFYRVGMSMQTWYTCKLCKHYWKGE
jgi:hypothetical protein